MENTRGPLEQSLIEVNGRMENNMVLVLYEKNSNMLRKSLSGLTENLSNGCQMMRTVTMTMY